MTETYKGDPQSAAADALLRTIALYKAAGFSLNGLQTTAYTFWSSTPAATPASRSKPQPA